MVQKSTAKSPPPRSSVPARKSAAPSRSSTPAPRPTTATPAKTQHAATTAPVQHGGTAAPTGGAAPAQTTAANRAASGAAAKPSTSTAPNTQDKVHVDLDHKEPEKGGAMDTMFQSMGSWAQDHLPQGVQDAARNVTDAVKGAMPQVKEAMGKASQVMDKAKEVEGFVGSLKKDGLTPQNADKLNGLLAKIDSPEAAQKLLKENPQLGEALRALGGDKLNQLFQQTGQNMNDCKTLYDILGPTKLGGADGRVTTGDSWAIANGAMRDPQFRDMAKGAAISTLQRDGHPFAARFVARHPRIADNQIQKRGPGEMASELNKNLSSMGLTGPTDPQQCRNLSYRELNQAAIAGQRLAGEKNPQSLTQTVQNGIWNPQPTPTMSGIQNQVRQQAQQALSQSPLSESDFAQSALNGTINAIPKWVQGNQQEAVRKYWEANTHVYNLLRGMGVDGK